MKWPWEYLFDHIYTRYVKALRENKELREKLEQQDGIIAHDSSFEPDSPSQGDKPSPSSSLSKSDLMARLRKAFPENKFSHFTVADTNSMEPYIDDNSIVVVEDVDDNFNFRTGQVVIYQRPHPSNPGTVQYVIHKIISISNSGKSFYIKGDNNYFADGWVSLKQVRWNLVNVGYFEQTEQGD